MGNRTAVKIYNNAHNLDIITKNQKKVEIYIYTILLVYVFVIKLRKNRLMVKKILYKSAIYKLLCVNK